MNHEELELRAREIDREYSVLTVGHVGPAVCDYYFDRKLKPGADEFESVCLAVSELLGFEAPATEEVIKFHRLSHLGLASGDKL